ncbi:MAG: transcription termination factor NusA [Chloroherpetonaceae bacterium]|nr:transcription termination factor NusA [Chthonomonadaceae bacterium]MDW8206320.1 transcription termination factor NusA [Chloroherpetonaceae bacterium]
MNGEFLEALQAIARERDIPLETLVETVESALATAYKRNFATNMGVHGNIRVRIVPDKSAASPFRIFCEKRVVEVVENEQEEISLEDARALNPDVLVGETVEIPVNPGNFGRIAAQTARQVMMQRIREAERRKIFDEFSERVGEVMTGVVQRREGRNVVVNLGKLEALLPVQEQVETEPYRSNDRIKVYVLEVRETTRGAQVIVSRTHPSLIRRLFELEVPEIADGIVTIKSVAREPGARSKIAVVSRDEGVDPVGACVGHRGSRVQAVVNELYDEKIDIVRWHADPAVFIAEALSPAKAVKVTVNEEAKSASVVVPDNQLSLAIGKAGQNVRLAARLTGWRIDIRSEAQVARAALQAIAEEAEKEAMLQAEQNGHALPGVADAHVEAGEAVSHSEGDTTPGDSSDAGASESAETGVV